MKRTIASQYELPGAQDCFNLFGAVCPPEPIKTAVATASAQASLLEPEITSADLRLDAQRAYLHVIVEHNGTEYQRNFEPDANDDRILEDWHKDSKTWRVI